MEIKKLLNLANEIKIDFNSFLNKIKIEQKTNRKHLNDEKSDISKYQWPRLSIIEQEAQNQIIGKYRRWYFHTNKLITKKLPTKVTDFQSKYDPILKQISLEEQIWKLNATEYYNNFKEEFRFQISRLELLQRLESNPKQSNQENNIRISSQKPVYLQFTSPDPFYSDLIQEINGCWSHNYLIGMDILIKKLIENLLIDILRHYYGMEQSELFFSQENERFQNYSVLLQNFKDKIQDINLIGSQIPPGILISDLEIFCESGNNAAHNFETDKETLKKSISGKQNRIQNMVNVLSQILITKN